MGARRQLLLGPGARHAAVGEQLVEARHHLLLGHHRQLGQLAGLEPPGVDPGQAPGVERGTLQRACQQRPQLLALVVGQLPGIPAQPADVLRQAAGQPPPEARAQGAEGAIGDRGHGFPSRSGTDTELAGRPAISRASCTASRAAGDEPGSAACSSLAPAPTAHSCRDAGSGAGSQAGCRSVQASMTSSTVWAGSGGTKPSISCRIGCTTGWSRFSAKASWSSLDRQTST